MSSATPSSLRPSIVPVASPAPSVRQDASDDLAGRLRTVTGAARRTREATDPDAVHDLRVAIRRLTASLDLWLPALEPRAARRARRRARRIRRDLAALRDLEVLRAELRAGAEAAGSDLRVTLERPLARLDARLFAERERAPRAASKRRVSRLARTVAAALREAPAAAKLESAAALAAREVERRRFRALAALEQARSRNDDTALHAARIQVKRWRYAAELADAIGADSAPSPAVTALRKAQESLGRVQDLALAIRWCESRARRARRKGRAGEADALETLFAEISRERANAADRAQRRSTTLSGDSGAGRRGPRA